METYADPFIAWFLPLAACYILFSKNYGRKSWPNILFFGTQAPESSHGPSDLTVGTLTLFLVSWAASDHSVCSS